MNELPTVWAERLRTATSDSARVLARCALAAAIYRLACARLRARGVPADVAAVEANLLAFEVSRRVEAGQVQPGLEDAYVRRCAHHAAIDHHRETSGVRAARDLRDVHEELADERDPERLLSDSQDAALVAARVERLRALIARAPGSYRDVLHEVYVSGTLIEALAERLLADRMQTGEERLADAAALRRARGAVDQRLTRARAWIRARIGVVPRQGTETVGAHARVAHHAPSARMRSPLRVMKLRAVGPSPSRMT